MSKWSIQKARELYHIDKWSDGFFDISEDGKLQVFPNTVNNQLQKINLHELINKITAKHEDIDYPILLRFTDILQNRINDLNKSFKNAIVEHAYHGKYVSVYPIKVNQQRTVIETILNNATTPVGIETGSKPELLAALSMTKQKVAMIVCNGYKDKEYLRLALIGQRLGHKVYIILEKFSELDDVLNEAAKCNIQPILGIRIRLTAIGNGKWQHSNGEKAKFGFSPPQILDIIKKLKENNCLSILQVLHFHLGSQIANIADIQKGIEEGVRYYETLRELGAPINTIDVGGGLGVDYEGTRSQGCYSINYNIADYANNIVKTIAKICDTQKLTHPDIITESGRAMTAHHAMLITNVISAEPACDTTALHPPNLESPPILKALWNDYMILSERNAIEKYHDSNQYMSEIHRLYIEKHITFETRVHAEKIYFASCKKLINLLQPMSSAHRKIIDQLQEKLAYKFICNFSLFQSLPDSWAINQVFPIMPLSRLDEMPTARCVLHDITCDSDGRIDTYVNNYGLESTLPLAPYDAKKPYLIGIFLVGAYQEILGDLHNLFGVTHAIQVNVMNNGAYQFTHTLPGDTVESALRQVNFDSTLMLQSYQTQLKQAALTKHEYQEYYRDLTNGLKGYTYFET